MESVNNLTESDFSKESDFFLADLVNNGIFQNMEHIISLIKSGHEALSQGSTIEDISNILKNSWGEMVSHDITHLDVSKGN